MVFASSVLKVLKEGNVQNICCEKFLRFIKNLWKLQNFFSHVTFVIYGIGVGTWYPYIGT